MCSPLVTTCDTPSAFHDFEALHLRRYWYIGRSVLVFFGTCSPRFQMTMSQTFGVRSFFPRIELRKLTANDGNFRIKLSNLTSINSMRIRLLTILEESFRNQPFLKPY